MTLEELGRRAVACKHFYWMPGMRWEAVDECGRLDDYQPEYMAHPIDAVPDLSDPATLGCVLSLVREAWKEEDMGAFRYDDTRWCVECTPGERQHRAFYGVTEAEALVAALERAP